MPELKEAPRPKTENGQGVNKDVAPRTTAAPTKSTVSPFAYMRRFAEEMDQLFEDFGFRTGFRLPSLLPRRHELIRNEASPVPTEWAPRIAVFEKEGQFVVHADLPGLTKDDIKVEIADDVITVQGERKYQKKEDREGYCYSECSYGSFYRAIPLPAGADGSKAVAHFTNGVLEITVPAPALAAKKPRRLEVREGK
jgi:HSP20 family protein